MSSVLARRSSLNAPHSWPLPVEERISAIRARAEEACRDLMRVKAVQAMKLPKQVGRVATATRVSMLQEHARLESHRRRPPL